MSLSNRRGILISNHASKVAHSSLRGQYTPFLEAAMLPMQVGGRPHKSVQQGAHALRLFMDLCRQRNLACGVIFLDIRTAYYKVLRELVAKIHHPADRLPALLEAFNLPPSAMQALENRNFLMRTTSQVSAESTPTWRRCWESYTLTAGLEGLTVTAIGTRPGSCFADVFFNFLFAAVHRRSRSNSLRRRSSQNSSGLDNVDFNSVVRKERKVLSLLRLHGRMTLRSFFNTTTPINWSTICKMDAQSWSTLAWSMV